MSSATTISVENAGGTPEVNPWLIGVVVSLAAFMEVLDTSIANVALPHIAGNLGASNDESTWVLTSYLVSNAIVLPISGFLVSLVGRKRFFLDLHRLLHRQLVPVWVGAESRPSASLPRAPRRLRGRTAADDASNSRGYVPARETRIGFRSIWRHGHLRSGNRPDSRGMAHRQLFLALDFLYQRTCRNSCGHPRFPTGQGSALLDPGEGPDDKFRFRRVRHLAIAVGALQVALDKGQEDDWFGSHFITALLIIAAVGLISLVIWEWFHNEPIVDVHLFKNFNFMSCSLMFFVVGVVLFSSTVLLPQFLQTLMGYTAQKAGMVLSVAAILLLILLQVVGHLTTRFQARHILAFGWITLALGMYVSCKRIDLLISFGDATWLRIMQYLPVGFLFVPLTMAGYVGMPKNKTNAAAGLMNFMRNMGQSVGTSAVTTLIARRSQYHQSVLAAYTRSPQFNAAVAELTTRLSHAGFDLYSAQQAALSKMYEVLNTQAQALSYVDVYWLLAVTAALMFLLCFLLEKNKPGGSGEIQVH